MTKNSTQKAKLLAALERNVGKTAFTVAQASSRYGIVNVRARIDELRNDGYDIIGELKTSKATGRQVAAYRLVKTPSKKSSRKAA
jgi:hypothetical protein